MGGLFTPYVIDSALALELSHSALFQEMADAIRKGDPLDLKFHYVGTRMAEYWMEVCKEDTYGHDFLTAVTSRAIEPIVKAAELEGRINFASLGAGDGKADIVFLDKLQRHLDLDMYLPVDISLDLLQTAVAAVMKAPSLRTDDRNFRMKPILADFERNLSSIEPFLTYDSTPNFDFLTGYTLGNAPEQTVIEALHRLMRPDDLLLVDARLHDAGEITDDRQLTKDLEARLKAPYSSPAVQKFAFGPVQIASDFAVSHEDIEFSHEIHVGRTTSVLHGVDVSLICKGLEKSDAFKKSPLGEDGGWLQRFRPRPLQLAAVTYYDFDALGKWFANRGFKVVWQQKEGDVGLYAMRVSGHQSGD
jgi:Histidine-specific methyltransferase, SAM-dependent